METPSKEPLYPKPVKGPAADDHSLYARERRWASKNEGDMQTKIVIFGVIFFLVVLISMAYTAGLGQYLKEW